MAAIRHGVYTTTQETSVSTPASVSSGIPFVVGSAPLSLAPSATRASVGDLVYATTYSEAVAALGYDDDWSKYTLCEVMYAYFKLYNMGPVIFCPVGTDATVENFSTTVAAGIENVEYCKTKFGVVPDLLLAPGFDNLSAVIAVMGAKATSINEKYQARAMVTVEGDTYTAAITNKNAGSFNEWMVVGYGHPKLGDYTFHASTMIAGRITSTDNDNNGIPYESPSNKYVPMDALVNASGTEITLSESQANLLNGAGIVTFINTGGQFVAWGNYTGAYPNSSDVMEYFIPIARMFDYTRKVVTDTFRDKVDKPLDRRLLDNINDSVNMWLNGLVGAGYLIGGRCELLDSENPLTSLMAGIITFHIYITPPGPAQEINFTIEYDASYLENLFS